MKKIIIITYYWPPAGGGGVQRWLKFVKYLPEFGWDPIVIAPQNADYPSADPSLTNDIPSNIKITKVPIWEPYNLFKFLTGKKKNEKVNSGFLFDDRKKTLTEKFSLWLRGNLLIPDPRLFWVRPVVREIKKIISTEHPEYIVTTGPPHSVHLAGLKIKQQTNIKWIADFRDPWSNIDYLDFFNLSNFARNKQKKLEGRVLQNADLVLSVSKNWKKELLNLGARNVEVITNGYDDTDFINYKKAKPDKFIFTYTGLITSLRNPVNLWELLEKLLEENTAFAQKFEFRLIGNIDAQVLKTIQEKRILSTKLNYLGYLSHSEVLNAYAESSMLLLLLTQSNNALGHIPGKLFEYMASETPILALGEKNGDVGRILGETGSGKIFSDSETDKIMAFISGSHKNKMKASSSLYKQYSRLELTKKLANNIEKL